MNIATEFETDMTVQSFAHVARQLAQSSGTPLSAAQYDQILEEAEKHRQALRLVERDVRDIAEHGVRKQQFTRAEAHRLQESAAQTVGQAQQAIARIAAQYAPHRLAA